MNKLWIVLVVLLGACSSASRLENGSALHNKVAQANAAASLTQLVADSPQANHPDCLPTVEMSPVPPILPLTAGQPRTGNTLNPVAANSSARSQPIRFVTSTGKPVKSVKVAVVLPSGVRCIFKTDADGMIPWINPDSEKKPEFHLVWDELIVPPGSDDYEASKSK